MKKKKKRQKFVFSKIILIKLVNGYVLAVQCIDKDLFQRYIKYNNNTIISLFKYGTISLCLKVFTKKEVT